MSSVSSENGIEKGLSQQFQPVISLGKWYNDMMDIYYDGNANLS